MGVEARIKYLCVYVFFCPAERTNGCDTGRAAEDTTYVLLLIFLVSATAFTLH